MEQYINRTNGSRPSTCDFLLISLIKSYKAVTFQSSESLDQTRLRGKWNWQCRVFGT